MCRLYGRDIFISYFSHTPQILATHEKRNKFIIYIYIVWILSRYMANFFYSLYIYIYMKLMKRWMTMAWKIINLLELFNAFPIVEIWFYYFLLFCYCPFVGWTCILFIQIWFVAFYQLFTLNIFLIVNSV